MKNQKAYTSKSCSQSYATKDEEFVINHMPHEQKR